MRHRLTAAILGSLLLTTGCRSSSLPVIPDRPHLTASVRLIEETFASRALGRAMHLRLIVPAYPAPHVKPSVVYLLHGAGTDFHDWTNNSAVAELAAQNIILVLPDAAGSYYINEATGRSRRYEDYLTRDVPAEVYRMYPTAARDRAHVAIVGISRGGYGATNLGLKHPDAYGFIGDISGALDFPERHFRWRAPMDSLALRKVFGGDGAPTRTANDPFKVIRSLPPAQVPYIYIACGDSDPLFSTNQRFAAEVTSMRLPHEFHAMRGGHDWNVWGAQLPLLESALAVHFAATPNNVY
jgi:S-formylglutathione hydrolase FrmB